MAAKPSQYHRGEMDIAEQQQTYHGFLVFSKWGSLALLAGILFFSLIFAVGVAFLGAFVSTVVVVAVGIILLKEKRKHPG